MRLSTKTIKTTLIAFLFGITLMGFAQNEGANQPKQNASTQGNQTVKNDPVKSDSSCVVQGGNPGSPTATQCVPAGTNVVIINDAADRDNERLAAYKALLRARLAQEEAARA